MTAQRSDTHAEKFEQDLQLVDWSEYPRVWGARVIILPRGPRKEVHQFPGAPLEAVRESDPT